MPKNRDFRGIPDYNLRAARTRGPKTMHFEIVGTISKVETIAVNRGIRILPVLRKRYGAGRWRKLKGIAQVRLDDGTIRLAEIHWFEAHGIGKRKIRIKRYLD